MKTFSILVSLLLGFVTASVQAGPQEVYKQVAPPPPPLLWGTGFYCATACGADPREVWMGGARPPPPLLWGTGFYGAIDMGANIYQNRGDTRTFTDNNPNSPFFGDSLEVDPKNDVGFFGGIKLGYVFGTGVVRPTLEGDFFYNGFRGGANFTLRDSFDNVVAQRNVTTWINTGAFMGNFILRFAPGNQRFQPYVGAGVGIYYAESAGTEVVDPVTGRVPFNTGGGRSHADLAWQIIA